MTKTPLLIDTDPGVDDALAILMAHAHGDVVGLSIAAGNVGLAHTVSNALKLVEVIGACTPVFAGCAAPLVLPAADAAFVHGLDGFGDTGYAKAAQAAQAEHAALAILRLSREHAGRLVLVAMAPLANLALALRLDPELPSRVARLVIMGGAVTGRGNIERVPAEFNIGFDPEAAHIVFSSWPKFELVDWEATLRHGLAFEAMAKWLAADDPRAAFYASIAQKTHAWTRERGRQRILVADALAMAVALDPSIVERSVERHVAIELNGTLTRGATVVDWDERLGAAPNARIVLGVDQARFEALVASGLGAS
ncbi:MAG TPA: nucleoside hydrolase [Rudaea sp.]